MLRQKALKRVAAVVAVTPVVVITTNFLLGRLGSNPIATALNQVGLWTLIVLLASLACTPLKIVFGWNWPIQIRKLLGLAAFFYASLHLTIYLVLDQGFAWDEILKDIVKRKFITVGFLAFVILVPLAVTSRKGMVKRLGFRTWKRLHRLVYLAGVLGVIHFIWRVKADRTEPLIYGGILTALLLVRVLDALRRGGQAAEGG